MLTNVNSGVVIILQYYKYQNIICTPETDTMLYINYILIKIAQFKPQKAEKEWKTKIGTINQGTKQKTVTIWYILIQLYQ